VREDAVHHMYEVRPEGQIKTFFVAADFVGPERPQGQAAAIAQRKQLADDSSTRIEEFIADLENTTGPATLAYTIQRNSQDVMLALDHLKSVGIDFNDNLKKIESAYKILKNAAYYREIEVAEARVHIAVEKQKLYDALSKVYEGQDVAKSPFTVPALPNATPQPIQVLRAETVAPEASSSAPAIQDGQENSFVNKALHWISTHNGSSLIHHTLDKRVNYFGSERTSNAFIEQDINSTAHARQMSKPLEIAHEYLFDEPVLDTQRFTHEVSNEYSKNWVGPMLYDSIDVHAKSGWARFTVGYTFINGTTSIYALVLKVQ
jgi:hypothetical protein